MSKNAFRTNQRRRPRLDLELLEDRTAPAVFHSAAIISLPADGAPAQASPYPSTLGVSGVSGTITSLTVTLHNINHTLPDDIDIMLVGPTGADAVIFSDVGGSTGAVNVTVTLDDAAALALPDDGPLVSGAFQPTNAVGEDLTDVFPNPAPATTGGSALSVFNGADPNGTWQLFVTDDLAGESGSLATGWSLNITTASSANSVVLQGDGGSDTVVVTATGPDSGVYTVNGSAPIPFVGITSFTFSGGGGDDLLRINNPAGALFAPTGGIFYDGGGQPGDALENLGGSATSGSYSVGPGNGDGVVTHINGPLTQTITFTGLAPSTDTVVEPTFAINGTDASNSILLDNGTAGGDGLIRVSIDAFEPIEFANKINVTINGGLTGADGADVITLANTEASTGLLSLTVNTGPAAGGSTAGDSVVVRSTPAGVTTNINGDGGIDSILLEGLDATLDGILGPVIVAGNGGGAPGDIVRLNDEGLVAAAAGFTYAVTSTTVTRGAGPVITYGTVERLTLDARNVTAPAGNIVNVTSQANGMANTINAGSGNDAVNVSNSLGAVAASASLLINGEAGNDTLTVSFATGDPTTSGGLSFNGGPEDSTPGDRLAVSGVNANTVTLNFLPDDANGHRGQILLDGSTINYADLEPVAIDGTIANAIINLPTGDGNNQAVLEDDGGPADPDGVNDPGVSAVRSTNGTFEFTEFANPTTSLTVNTGGDGETVTIALLDTAFAVPVTVNGGAGVDLFRLDFSSGVNVIPTGGADFNGTGNDGVVLLAGFTAGTISHSYGNTLGDGAISVDGRIVDYSGINETTGVSDQLAASNRIFDFTAAAENIQITDDSAAGDGISRIRAPGEAVITDFRNPMTQITVNGDEGSDTFTNPTFDTLGAPPTANLNGRDGAGGGLDAADTFAITPSAATTFNIDGDNPLPPTRPGDSLTVTTTGTGNPFLTVNSGGNGFSGNFTFADRQPVNFQEIESLGNTVNLTITKDDSPDPVTAGANVTYTIVVSNNGPLGVAGAVVADMFPAAVSNVTFTSVATGGATGNTATGTGNINDTVSLPIGSTITYTATGAVAASASGSLSNTATVTAPAGASDSVPADNSSTEATAVNAFANLVVTKSDAPDPVSVNGNIAYTITLRNDGPSDAQGVSLVDDMPVHTGFVSFTAPAGFTTTTPAAGSTGKVRATTATLAAGAVATFTLVVRVHAQAPGTGPLVNTVNVAGTTTDTSPGNNTAIASTRIAHVSYIAVGAAKGSAPRVAVYTPAGAPVASFLAFNAGFRAGVRVAVGDVNGDGVSDIIVAAGPGAGPHVKIVDGTKLAGLSPNRTVPNSASLGSFFAYQKGFTGGVFVAAGDVDGDGRDDIITGQGAGSRGRVKVIDADRRHLRTPDGRISFAALHGTFLPYRSSFKGGVVVAAGDVNGDDRADVIAGPARGAAPVVVVNMADASLLASFFVRASHSQIGVTLAADFVNADDRADIIVGAGAGSAPSVQVFDGARLRFVDADGRITPAAALASKLVFERSFRGGVQVGAVDLDADGLAEILAGTGPTKRRILGLDMLRNVRERTIDVTFNAGSVGGN